MRITDRRGKRLDFTKIQNRTFEEVYSDHSDMLFRLALSHVGNKEDAEDVIHDVFIKYHDVSPEFSGIEHEKAWLIRATINKCRDLFRRHAVRRYVPLSELGNDEPSEDGKYDSIGVFDCVSSLDIKLRSVVTLHYLEGYSVEQTAKLLGISSSAVKMRLMRARESLKKYF